MRLSICVERSAAIHHVKYSNVRHFPGHSPDIFPPHLGYLPPPAVKAKIRILALTRTPDPNRSTSRPISFVHVNGIDRFIF